MKRVLLTGATGFVGANLTRRLLAEGHELHLLVRPGYSDWRIRGIVDQVQLEVVDFQDAQKLAELAQRLRPEWVFHLAASGAYSWQTDLNTMLQTNLLGTIHLVEACLKTGFEAFINTGSSSEYGFKPAAPAEIEWLEPNSHYAVTKASASLFCRYTAQSRQVPIYTLRLYSVYGPYEDPRRLMPTLIRCGRKGELPPLVAPETVRDYVYVEDVLDAYLLAAGKSGQEVGAIYNIGSGVQTSLREVVEVARKALGIRVEPEWGTMPGRIWDTSAWVSDPRKAAKELGWQPRFDFRRGFVRMAEWYAEHPEYLEPS